MIILIRDSLRQLVLLAKKVRHRLLFRIKFIDPLTLQKECIHTYQVAPENMVIAEDFRIHSSTYRHQPIVKFSQEEAGIYRLGREISIHEARFIPTHAGTFIDVGHQSRDPLPMLRKPFAKKPAMERIRLLMPWAGGGATRW